jgi:transglutaminase-like putative cysteine protease
VSGIAAARALPLPRGRAVPSPGRPGARRVAFAGLAAIAAGQWASLLAGADAWRFALVVAIALLAAAAAERLPARAPGRRRAARAAIAIAGSAAGLVALGLPADQLAPWRWGDLAATLDHGRSGLRGEFDYPLAAGNRDAQLLLVALLPVTLSVAAVLSFRRLSGDRGPGRVGGLCIALAAVAIPATVRPTAMPLLWGLATFGLVALWLWGGRLASSGSVALISLAAALGAAAVALTPAEPVVDYRSWTIAAAADEVAFEWDHDYGPIDWPRNGTPLFRVDADGPAYWRAEVLDEFDATRWRRSAAGGPALPTAAPSGSLDSSPWVHRATFSVLGLESPLVLSPGDALGMEGIYGVDRSADATLTAEQDPLSRDGSYTVWGFQPDPRPRRMRAAADYPADVRAYTSVAIPVRRPGSHLTRGGEIATPEAIYVPPWGTAPRGPSPAARAIARSPYRRVGALADRLTAGAPTAYDAARSVLEYLQRGFQYDESPPLSALPLKSFLFRDRVGYCQQFSGAMALMLRMAGIPARVAVGFTAGTPTGSSGDSFLVTDLDAHSWVEVYFTDIGWVTFDPTPNAAPAQSQLGDVGMAAFGLASAGLSGGGGGGGDRGSPKDGVARAKAGGGAAAADGEGGGGPVLIVLAALALMATGAVAARSVRHRRLPAERATARAIAELGPALGRAGIAVPGGLTLLAAEERLRGAGMRRARDYVGRLRESRYAAGSHPPPGLGRRLAARRDLGRGSLRRRLALMLAMPPGGPRAAPDEGSGDR